ncbi:Arm DNA-binding domain-containing protein [Bacillus subtilis subsp. subtilis]|nr:Arm DNA-binding domain-containing protein [Bacillus subtilis subsp. subtilis]
MLTDTKLRSLKPKSAVYRVADASGLCIEVRPTGTKVWRYRYRYLGKASIITIDEYGTLADVLCEMRDTRVSVRFRSDISYPATRVVWRHSSGRVETQFGKQAPFRVGGGNDPSPSRRDASAVIQCARRSLQARPRGLS